MKKSVFFTFSFFLIISCFTDSEDENYVEYKIEIAQITFDDTLTLGDSLIIAFEGMVGNDGCHRFSRFDVKESDKTIDITVWGEHSGGNVCPCVMVYLNGKTWSTLPEQAGNYTLRIHQPDGSILTDSLRVQ